MLQSKNTQTLSASRRARCCEQIFQARRLHFVHVHRQFVSRTVCSSTSSTSPSSSDTATKLPSLLPLDATYEDQHEFADFANWLIPESVMLGRYPFVEPSRCTSRRKGEQQLDAILSSGINTFVCLLDEIPSQQEMKLGGKGGFLPYKSTAELIQSALNGPPPMELVDGSLRNPTLNQFLPPKRYHQDEQAMYKPKNLHFLHSPIVDMGLPSKQALEELLVDLRQRVEAGEKLYIHCWGGRGRAGTVGACLLATLYGLGPEEVLERVQRAYDTRRDPQRSASPETDEQFQFVRDFVSAMQRK